MTDSFKNLNDNFSLMTFNELEKSVSGKILFNFSQEDCFYSVAVDSRSVKNGSLFVPLRGEKQDGHIYIEDALQKGSFCFIADDEYIGNGENIFFVKSLCEKYKVCCITVKNNLYALQAAAKCYLTKFPNLYKIGITGSSGKTTAKEILASIYSVKYNTVINTGNFNSETGLPLSVFAVRPEHEVGIFELGMNRRGEIAEITNVLLPNAAIITNIGTAHIGILGTKQAIVEEKKQIFSNFTENCIGVIPDCEFTDFLKDIPAGDIQIYSEKKLKGLEKIEYKGVAGTKIFYKGEEILFPLPGVHNVQNAIACISLAEFFSFSAKEIKKGLENVKPLFGRSQITDGAVTCFMDCYNANPESMSAAIDFCDSVKTKGLKHYVLASMLELGKYSFSNHIDVIKKAFNSNADAVYLFGDEIVQASEKCESLKKVFKFNTCEFENLKTVLSQNLHKDDFVLLKGSRGMALERLKTVWEGGMLNV